MPRSHRGEHVHKDLDGAFYHTKRRASEYDTMQICIGKVFYRKASLDCIHGQEDNAQQNSKLGLCKVNVVRFVGATDNNKLKNSMSEAMHRWYAFRL